MTRPVVALVTDAIFPYHHGGKEQRTHHVARHLGARAEVHVYTMKWWEGPAHITTDDGVHLHAICPKLPLYAGERRSIVQAVAFALCTLRLLLCRFDAIEVDSIPVFPVFTLRLVTMLRRRRLACTWHEIWGEAYWRSYLGGRRGRLAGRLETLAVRTADDLIAASEYTAERLAAIARPTQSILVSRSGIDLTAIAAIEPFGPATDVCVVGRLLQHKRIDLLVGAVAALRNRGRDVRTLVIGSGPEHAALTKLATRLGVADLIEFRADVGEQTDVFGLLKASRVFAFPSEREGFGIAVLEALACGLPVVTTCAPDNAARHLVERLDAGWVCTPDVDGLADAIELALSTAGPRVPHLDGYTWPSIAAELAGVLACA